MHAAMQLERPDTAAVVIKGGDMSNIAYLFLILLALLVFNSAVDIVTAVYTANRIEGLEQQIEAAIISI